MDKMVYPIVDPNLGPDRPTARRVARDRVSPLKPPPTRLNLPPKAFCRTNKIGLYSYQYHRVVLVYLRFSNISITWVHEERAFTGSTSKSKHSAIWSRPIMESFGVVRIAMYVAVRD